MMWYHFIG